MSYTAIERKIDHDATVDTDRLFAPINIKGFNAFSLQFYFDAIAAAAFPASQINLRVSNSDTDVPPPDSDFSDTPTFPFAYQTQILSPGVSTSYIFVGLAGGVGNVTWITCSYKNSGVTVGRIKKVILNGDMGNS